MNCRCVMVPLDDELILVAEEPYPVDYQWWIDAWRRSYRDDDGHTDLGGEA